MKTNKRNGAKSISIMNNKLLHINHIFDYFLWLLVIEVFSCTIQMPSRPLQKCFLYRIKSKKLLSKPLTAWLKVFWLDHQTFRKEKRNRNKLQLQIWKIISLRSNKNKTFQILEMSTIFIWTAIESFWPTYFIKDSPLFISW